jgi:Uncharacterised nucleotidyltransferase
MDIEQKYDNRTLLKSKPYHQESLLILDAILDGFGRKFDRDYVTNLFEKRQLDVSELISLSISHRSECILYKKFCEEEIEELFPGKYQIFLNQRYESNIIRNYTLLEESCKISTHFTRRGFPHAFMKGISSCVRLDKMLGSKSINDIDLLVSPASLYDAIILLKELGYVYGEYHLGKREIIEKDLESLDKYAESPQDYHHLKYPMAKVDRRIPGSAIRIELHVACGWRKIDKLAYEEINTDDLISNSVIFKYGEFSFHNVCDADQLKILYLQLYHDFLSLWDIVDRNKDFELYKLREVCIINMQYNSPGTHQKSMSGLWIDVFNTGDKILSLFQDNNLDLSQECPKILARYGLLTDGIKGTFSGNIYDRFMSPISRYKSFEKSELLIEEKRRKIWIDHHLTQAR